MHPPRRFPPPQTPSGRGEAKAPGRASGPARLPAPGTRFLLRHPRVGSPGHGAARLPSAWSSCYFLISVCRGVISELITGRRRRGKGLWTHTLCINHHHRDLCSLLGEGGDLHSWEEARAGGSAFLSQGRMSPRRRKKSRAWRATDVMCLQSWVGGDGGGWGAAG